LENLKGGGSVQKLKHRIMAAVEIVMPEMMEHIFAEKEYCLNISCITRGAYVKFY
jgi:hypothetical protein